jgi:aminoglycoside phosphotransferase (APT) family kinase protein
MEARIAAYLAHRMPEALDIAVDGLARIHGGSSQETYRLRACWRVANAAIERRLILRRAPAAGLVVAERDLEYSVYRALAGSGVPVPGVHFLELDPSWLERPFFVMDLMPGKPGHFYQGGDPYEGMGAALARRFWHHLGQLAALDHRKRGLEALRNGEVGDLFWSRELDRWEALIDGGEAVVEPAVRGALRWLRRHPPPEPARPAIVHGDYRSGNFLFTPDARISAILDWEMAHIGDPLEDVAWALDPYWSMARHLPEEEGLAIWQAASGLTVDRKALDWWRLFSPVKGCAIWTTAEASFAEGRSAEMVVAMSGLRANAFHRRVILDRMAERGAMG